MSLLFKTEDRSGKRSVARNRRKFQSPPGSRRHCLRSTVHPTACAGVGNPARPRQVCHRRAAPGSGRADSLFACGPPSVPRGTGGQGLTMPEHVRKTAWDLRATRRRSSPERGPRVYERIGTFEERNGMDPSQLDRWGASERRFRPTHRSGPRRRARARDTRGRRSLPR
jgi:hypothetical protein